MNFVLLFFYLAISYKVLLILIYLAAQTRGQARGIWRRVGLQSHFALELRTPPPPHPDRTCFPFPPSKPAEAGVCMGGVGHGVGESGMGSGRVLATATNLASVPNLAQPHIDSRNELENQPQFACLQSAVTAGGRVCVCCVMGLRCSAWWWRSRRGQAWCTEINIVMINT